MKKITSRAILVWLFFLLLAATLAFFEHVTPPMAHAESVLATSQYSCPEVSTEIPEEVPTDVPVIPTDVPVLPTEEPTSVPTEVPTNVPTDVPTEVPTVIPTDSPTHVPTEPVVVPTSTIVPTLVPERVVEEEDEDEPETGIVHYSYIVTPLPTLVRCDPCEQAKRQADSLERIANIFDRFFSWMKKTP